MNFIKNKQIQQIDPSLNGAITAYANVDSVYQYQLQQYQVTELFLTDINGTFAQGSKIQCTLDDGSKITERIYSIPSDVLFKSLSEMDGHFPWSSQGQLQHIS